MTGWTEADTWRELVSTALVGTARRSVPDAPRLPPVPATDPTVALLNRAALATIQRRAGYAPGGAAPLEPAPEETTPAVGEAAARRLRTILQGEWSFLLPEWLELAAERGLRAPHDVLPELLSAGHSAHLRDGVAAVAGSRGRWLASVVAVPQWAYLAATGAPGDRFDEEAWEHGTPGDRRRVLAALRAEDPGRARELLSEAWTGERAERRRDLLLTFKTGLSPADEQFLDAVLDDRSANVRGAALTLLARLPESAHAHRLRGYARRCVHRGTADGGPPLLVEAPELDDPHLVRDLALSRAKQPGSQTELRREWLWNLLTHVPLTFWREHLDGTPEELVELAIRASQWDFFAGLANAALVQGSAEWARVLLRSDGAIQRMHDSRHHRTPSPSMLLAVLPAEERCAWAAERITEGAPADTLADMVAGHWTDELGVRVAERIRELAGERPHSRVLAELCQVAAQRMPPHLHHRFASLPSGTNQKVADLEATLRFRFEMRKEFP